MVLGKVPPRSRNPGEGNKIIQYDWLSASLIGAFKTTWMRSFSFPSGKIYRKILFFYEQKLKLSEIIV